MAFHAPSCQRTEVQASLRYSDLAACALDTAPVYGRVAGLLLAFARFREKTMHIVPSRRRQIIFDTPNFPEDQISATLRRRFL
jgi:hypothetical protein